MAADALQFASADHTVSPPHIHIPRDYNAALDLVERNLLAGRGERIAFIDDANRYTYRELAERVNRCANAWRRLGMRMEDRVVLLLHDTIDFPVAFLGAIKAGVVPIPCNTLLTAAEYEYLISDSRARAVIVSAPLLPMVEPLKAKLRELEHLIVSGKSDAELRGLRFEDWIGHESSDASAAPTTADDVCFWLYSSGSTGNPKGAVHLHSDLIHTAELYARPILGIGPNDVVFSAAKLFFAYGLGNALTFPLAVGATALLMAERPTPAAVFKRLTEHRPTIFYGVPTLYAALLASADFPARESLALSRCVSAGEALPADLGKRWHERTGVDILDGLGSTELLHIFLSNRQGEVRYGTTGKPVPGYALRIIDEGGNDAAPGEIGELQVSGPTSSPYYWNNRERSLATFLGPWTKSGDKYTVDRDGYYTYCGRSDDMLKVGGVYVSPFEVEAALATHGAVLEAAVVGHADESELIKPKAFVVLKPGLTGAPALAVELQEHVKARLAPFKYPRWIEFVAELPKTATGKIQRFKLRARA
ncbi:MAG TPA: benzoate-CoA ligase family protein [Casimicrobiaceae bacterium]|nr:benzoate-CoA ligase family protein [Casimicrobiaceae bacterium]